MSTTQPSVRTQHVPTPDVRVAPRTLRRLYGLQTSKRRFGRDLLIVLAWSSVALALALWVADGGIQAIDSSAKVFLAAGTVAGLVATDLMVIMLFLAARLPFIDRSLGHDRAIAMHNKLGRWVIIGLLLHAWMLVCGYAANSSTGLFDEVASLLGIPDLLFSVIALGALAAVGVSSMVVVKRKLPYEVWHVIHLVTYVAVGLSLPHQFSMSGVFAEGTWQRWYWVALFTAVALVILSFRVILPIVSSLEHRLVVSRVVLVDTDVVTIEMRGKRIDQLEVESGQFFTWRFLGRGLWWHQHPFSLSASPTDDTLRITIRALGRGTAKLLSVRPGTKVAIEGPYGIFTDTSRTQLGLTLVGVGIGISPIRALLESTDVVPGITTVILRASTNEQLYLIDEIDALCMGKGARLVALVGPRASDLHGDPTWLPEQYRAMRLQDLAPAVAHSDVYICGPQAIADLIIDDALTAGTPASAIHNERFSW
ncbi:MAG: ferric reductase-like transmembrane domain-containing protein [Propionibacteriaceae bacterium]